MSRLDDRWNERRKRNGWEPVASLGYAESIRIAAPANVVWSFCHSAETAHLTDASIIRGYTAPGTPPEGLGEHQCFDYRGPDGSTNTVVLEVVALEHGRSATTVRLPGRWPRTTTTVDPNGSGCILTLDMWLPVWEQWSAEPEWAPELITAFDELLAWTDAYLERVKVWTEGGWTPTRT